MVRKRKSVAKKAGRLVIKPRKAGERVPRKLVLRDGTALSVLIKERKMQNLIVDKMITVYDNHPNRVLKADPLYMKAEGYLPDNLDMRYHVIDRNDIRFIQRTGKQFLCMLRMMPSEVKRLPNFSSWHDPSMLVYKVEPSVFLSSFFAKNDWKVLCKLWVTENLEKDERLVEAFKTVVIPLYPKNWNVDAELSKLMYFQNHQFWITNSKSGKSEFPRLIGEIPSNEWTVAGLFGGMDNGMKRTGVMEGAGVHFFDEVMYVRNVNDDAVLPQILTYLQQGTASRALKVRIECRGSKAVIFASNPSSSADMLSSVSDFIKVISGLEYPEKVGSRIGSLLVGNDFKTIRPEGTISEYRDVVFRVMSQVLQKFYFTRIYPILKSNMQWACDDEELKNTYLAYSEACPNEMVRNFIRGMSLAIPKLKLGAIRSILLDNLDAVAVGFNKKNFQKSIIEREREEVLSVLVKANFRSFEKVSHAIDKLTPDEEGALLLHEKFPKMSVRDIGLLLEVSKSSVSNWLSDEKVDDSGKQDESAKK